MLHLSNELVFRSDTEFNYSGGPSLSLFYFGANFAIHVGTFIMAPPLGAAKWFLGSVSTRLLYPDMLPQLQYLAFARKDNTPWI